MKRLLLLLLLIPVLALAQNALFSRTTPYAVLTQDCSADAGAGVDLSGAVGYIVTTSADRTDGGLQTLLSGTTKCCVYAAVSSGGSGVNATKRWMPCSTALDVALADGAGRRDFSSAEFESVVGAGKVDYVPSAILVDGGTSVSVTITVRKRL